MITSWTIFLLTLFIGYGICHFLITPLLLKKYRNRGFFESSFWEGLQAENHLKDLMKETDDIAIKRTLVTIKYSKLMIIFSIIATVTFAVLGGLQ